MGKETSQTILGSILVENTMRCCQCGSNKAKVDIDYMIPGHVIDDDDTNTCPEASAENSVTFVEIRAEGSRRLECLYLTTKPSWKDERTDESYGDIRTHPELRASAVLTDRVTGGKEQNNFLSNDSP